MTVTRDDPQACLRCGSNNLEQDPDVLDTWFSSALWPFSTLGWPEKTPDFEYFYPTSVMETGYDILFFWVARMIMFALEFTGEAPFHTVYLHGLIRDEQGRKMSKTYGNVIDPLEVMDAYGTDALRFTLLVGSAPGNDINLSIKKVEANRNFANKIWNVGRFIIGALGQAPSAPQGQPQWSLADSWIWARLQGLIRDVERLFQGYQYGEAGRQIYEFFWGEFADWYVEVAKLQLAEGGDCAYYTARNLVRILDLCLRLLHPFTPFITEELWGHLKKAVQDGNPSLAPVEGWPSALIVAPWPKPRPVEEWEASKVADFGLVQEVVRAVRNLRAEKGVKPGRRIPALLVSAAQAKLLQEQSSIIASLAYLDLNHLEIVEELQAIPEGSVPLVIGPVEVYLPLASLVDVDAERKRLEEELAETLAQIRRLDNLLHSEFATKAPPPVVSKERERLAGLQEKASRLQRQIDSLLSA